MPLRDVLAALVVAFVWGVTFIVIKIGVTVAPPLLMSALRFSFAAVPAVFFVKPPKTKPSIVIAYGVTLGVVQFGGLFMAMNLGLPAGLASILVQAQVFFTVAFALVLFGQKPSLAQVVGLVLGCIGVAVIGIERAHGAGVLPFVLVLVAAAGWGAANVIGMKAGRVDMFAFIVWSSLAAPLPLFALSFLVEGSAAVATLLHPSLLVLFCALFLAGPAQLFGFGIWSRLLSQHSAAAVTPFALLVPVVGMVSAALWFGEPASTMEWIGGAFILAGLATSVLGERFMSQPPA